MSTLGFSKNEKKKEQLTILANRISNTFLLIMYVKVNTFLALKRGILAPTPDTE